MKPKTTDMDKQAAERLKEAFKAAQDQRRITYRDIGEKLGITAGAVSHYMNGTNALNVRALLKICALLPGASAKEIYPEIFQGVSLEQADDPAGILDTTVLGDSDDFAEFLSAYEALDPKTRHHFLELMKTMHRI
ncbi:MAG: hypothetical protein CSB47_10435 [Proteobacteria bacterium]|nr:MAG: hypothetical protein CSB47_10435 [Pseudomonadota bacterium]